MAATDNEPQVIEDYSSRTPDPGEVHPDPDMAALGWHGGPHGVWVKAGQVGAADVAALERYAARLHAARTGNERTAAMPELEAG